MEQGTFKLNIKVLKSVHNFCFIFNNKDNSGINSTLTNTFTNAERSCFIQIMQRVWNNIIAFSSLKTTQYVF